MGLLDNLFYSQSADYGGQQGGLLDFLRNSQMQNDQYQPGPANFPPPPPSAAFADRFGAMPGAPAAFAPGGRDFAGGQFDPQTFAPNQAQPIAVGDYQMPRIGGAPQFASDPAAIPQNAMPAQGQLPPGGPMQQPAPMQAQQQIPPALGGNQGAGFLDNLSRGLRSVGQGGGIISALRGQPNDAQSQAQQNLKAQYDAVQQTLIQGGMSPREAQSKAMLAVMNPEAGKTILQEALTSKEKYGIVSEDPFAGKKYGFINEREQTVNGQPINAQGGPAGSSSPLADMEKAKASGVQGEALYEYLPKQIAPMVKAMIEGRQPLPTGAAMRNPATLALIDAAHSVDPTFDATSWAARQAGAKDFTSGKSSEMVRAANQTLAHVGSLLDAMDNLKNTQYPAANYVGNTFRDKVLGQGEQGAFRTNAHAVAEEMSKVFKGANLSDAEIRQWESNLSENMSPEQQKTQIAKLSELLHGSLAALEEKRTAAIGPMAAAKAGSVIKEEGQRTLERIDKWVKGNAPPAQAAPSGALPSGWSVKVR